VIVAFRTALPLMLAMGCASLGAPPVGVAAPPARPADVLFCAWDARTRAFVPLEGVATAALAAKVVMVGEIHTSVGCHAMQRWILERLLAAGKRPVVVVEWFQRPFQAALDDYVAGRADEKELLRRTEYERRWRFDWERLYAPLLRLCRDRGVRVLAANVRAEVSKAVLVHGLEGFRGDERAALPAGMVLDDRAHRRYVLARFEAMRRRGILPDEKLERFYQAQVLWDETMAESAAKAFKSLSPDEVLVFFAGAGHVGSRTAVPGRFRRRSGVEPLVLLPLPADTPLKAVTATDRASCDYAFFFEK